MSLRTAFAASVAAAVVLGAALVPPAHADDQPFPLPPGVPTAGMPQAPAPSGGPTFVITPGSDGDDLGKPVQGPVRDPATRKPKPSPAKVAPTTKAPVPGSSAVAGQAPASADTEGPAVDDRWWAVGAGAFLLLVLTELFRVGTRRS